MTSNLDLWNSVSQTDPAWTKSVPGPGGKVYTQVQPYMQLRQATEIFGPYGQTWGLCDLHWTTVDVGDGVLMMTGTFRHPTGSFDVVEAGQWTDSHGRVDDDLPKKLITGCIGKALSYLGFSADIYTGEWDAAGGVTKYQKTPAPVSDAYEPPPSQEGVVTKAFPGAVPERGPPASSMGAVFHGVPMGAACPEARFGCRQVWPCPDHPRCPRCTKPMWDNREPSRGGRGKYPKKSPAAPDFSCQDKACSTARGVYFPGEWQARILEASKQVGADGIPF